MMAAEYENIFKSKYRRLYETELYLLTLINIDDLENLSSELEISKAILNSLISHLSETNRRKQKLEKVQDRINNVETLFRCMDREIDRTKEKIVKEQEIMQKILAEESPVTFTGVI